MGTWHWKVRVSFFCNIYTFQQDTHCCSTDCLLMHRCQLYMFRTVTVHPQELLFRCCMCRLWYVVRTALSDTSRWYSVWGRTRCYRCRLWYVVRTALSDTSRWYNVWGRTRCCMCRLSYVVRNALSDTSRWYNVWGRISSNVVPAGRIR